MLLVGEHMYAATEKCYFARVLVIAGEAVPESLLSLRELGGRKCGA